MRSPYGDCLAPLPAPVQLSSARSFLFLSGKPVAIDATVVEAQFKQHLVDMERGLLEGNAANTKPVVFQGKVRRPISSTPLLVRCPGVQFPRLPPCVL